MYACQSSDQRVIRCMFVILQTSVFWCVLSFFKPMRILMSFILQTTVDFDVFHSWDYSGFWCLLFLRLQRILMSFILETTAYFDVFHSSNQCVFWCLSFFRLQRILMFVCHSYDHRVFLLYVIFQTSAHFDICLLFLEQRIFRCFTVILQTAHISMFDCHSSDLTVFRCIFVILQTSVYWCVWCRSSGQSVFWCMFVNLQTSSYFDVCHSTD